MCNTAPSRSTRARKFSANDLLHLLAVRHDDAPVSGYSHSSEVTCHTHKDQVEELAELVARARARALAAASALAQGQEKAKAAPAPLAYLASAVLVQG